MARGSAWIAPDPVVERLQLDDASWVDVVRNLVPTADEVHDALVDIAWEQGRVFRYERWVDDPRLSSWQAGDRRPGRRAGFPVGGRDGGDRVVVGEPERLLRVLYQAAPL